MIQDSHKEEVVLIDAETISKNFGIVSGTVLRTALVLSSALNKPFELTNFLTDRKPQGLSKKHVETINQYKKATKALVDGNNEGSTKIIFAPQQKFSMKKTTISSKGSTSLIITPLIISATFSDEKFTANIKGLTHGTKSPSMTFLRETIIRYLNKYTSTIKLLVKRPAFFKEDLTKNEETTTMELFEYGINEFIESNDEENRPETKTETKTKEDYNSDEDEQNSEENEFNTELTIKGLFSLENAPRLDIQAEKIIAIKGEFFAEANLSKNKILERLSKLFELSFSKEKKEGLGLRSSLKYITSTKPFINIELTAYGGDEFGYDNDKPHIYSKEFKPSLDSAKSIDEQFLAFTDEFKKKTYEKNIDVESSELIFPLIALVGGSFNVERLSERLQGQLFIAKELFNLEVSSKPIGNGESQRIESLGMTGSLRKGAISIDEI